MPVTAGPVLAPRLAAISDAERKRLQRGRMTKAQASLSRLAEKSVDSYLLSQEAMTSAAAKHFDEDMRQAASGMLAGIVQELRGAEYKDKPYQKYIGAIEAGMQDSAATLPAFNANSTLSFVRNRITSVVAKELGVADIAKEASFAEYDKVDSAVSGILRSLAPDVGKAHHAALLALAAKNAEEYGAPIERVNSIGELEINHGRMRIRLPYGPEDKDRSDGIKDTIKTILSLCSPAIFSQKTDAELLEADRQELKDYIKTPYYAATRKHFEELSAQFVEQQRAVALKFIESNPGMQKSVALNNIRSAADNSFRRSADGGITLSYDGRNAPRSKSAITVTINGAREETYLPSPVPSPYTTNGKPLASRFIPWMLNYRSRYPADEARDRMLRLLNSNPDMVVDKAFVDRYFDDFAALTKKYLAEDFDKIEAVVSNPISGELETLTPVNIGEPPRTQTTATYIIDSLQYISNVYEHSTSSKAAKDGDWVKFATNDYRNDIKPQFSRNAITKSAATNGIVRISFGGKNARSYASTRYTAEGGRENTIVILPDARGDNFVVAHELGHAIEHSVRQVTECSMKFLGRIKDTSGKDVPESVGLGMEMEMGYRDQLINRYTGKIYENKSHEVFNSVRDQSTEVYSTTTEKLGKRNGATIEGALIDMDFRQSALMHLHATRGDLLDAKRSKGKAQPIAQPKRKEEPAPKPMPPKPEPPTPRPEPPKPQPKPQPKPPERAKPAGKKFDRSKMRDDVTYIGRR